ncbi:hypothetical protein ENBRE01_3481, partial [Enteropsectra breve]
MLGWLCDVFLLSFPLYFFIHHALEQFFCALYKTFINPCEIFIRLRNSCRGPWFADPCFRECKNFHKKRFKRRLLTNSTGENSKQYTAFSTPIGRFQFRKMPFGLVNAPSTFQRYMTSIFAELIGKFVMIYLDDIIIFSTSINEHLTHLETVLRILADHNLEINTKKCKFVQKQVKYLGFLISEGKLSVDPDKTTPLLAIPKLDSQTNIRSFLGFTNFYRRIIEHLSIKIQPILQLLKENTEHNHINALAAAQNITKEIISSKALVLPDHKAQLILSTDASQAGIGAC